MVHASKAEFSPLIPLCRLVQADSESNAFIIKAYKIVRNKEKSSENMVEVAEYISGSEQDLLSWVKSLA